MSGRQDPVTKQFLLLKSIALASWDATLMTYNDTMVPWYMIRVASQGAKQCWPYAGKYGGLSQLA